jgi:DNA-binding transcriptional MerR regulator
MLTIGEFSSATRLTVKALRIYHEEGILVPERVDPANGYRHYGEASFRRARAIATLRALGFSIEEMRDIFARCADDADLESFFRRRLAEVDEEAARLREARNLIKGFVETERELDVGATPGVTVRTLDDAWVCSIRYVGAYADIGDRFSELFAKAGRFAAGKPLALYHDCEYRESADVEAALPVRKAVSIPGIECRLLAGGRFATALHRGTYESVGLAYRAIFEHIAASGLEAGVPSRESYLKGPGMIFPRDPRSFVTEVLVPVK